MNKIVKEMHENVMATAENTKAILSALASSTLTESGTMSVINEAVAENVQHLIESVSENSCRVAELLTVCARIEAKLDKILESSSSAIKSTKSAVKSVDNSTDDIDKALSKAITKQELVDA